MEPSKVRWGAIALFAVLASGFLLGSHYYLATRLVVEPELPPSLRAAGLGLIGLGALLLIAQPVGERLLRPPVSRIVSWPASVWMGVGFLLLNVLLASDALLWLAGEPAFAAEIAAAGEPSAARLRAGAVLLLALTAAGFGMRGALRPPLHRRVEVELARWPRELDGFRIAQISDVHLGPILGRRFAEQVTKRVNDLEPDLVAVTGDLVDGSVASLVDEVAPLSRLRAPCGVFFVTGNHDHYSGARAWARHAAELGMRVLRNERVPIERNGARFDLVGVDDHHGSWLGDGGEDLEAALRGRSAPHPAILLAHDPSTFKRARRMGVDLQISGHTHGGQIWPFGWFVRLVIPYVAGHYRDGGSQLYVSRGTGFWGPPMRLWAPAEITEITLRAPRAQADAAA